MIAAPPRLRARLLGPFRVEIGERVVNRWERPSARRLVQYLLLANAHTASREQLMEVLSPGLDREHAANAIAKSISMARSALGEQVVEASRSFVRLAVPVETDLAIAMAALERATAVGPGRRAALEDALALEGELLPEEPWAEWADAARVRLADLRRAAAIELARATANWAPVFYADPACEEAALAVIEAYAAAGERDLAVRTYQRHREVMSRELGLGISAEIEAAYQEAAAGEPATAEPPDDEAAYGRLLAKAVDDEERAAAWVGLASTAYRRGDMVGVIDTCRLALDSIGGGADRPEEGLGDVFAARRVLTTFGDVYSISVSHWEAAELLDQLGLLGRALAEREAEVRLLEAIDNPRNLAGALVHGSRLLSRLGRLDEAAAWASRGLDAALATGDSRLVAWAREEAGKVSGKS